MVQLIDDVVYCILIKVKLQVKYALVCRSWCRIVRRIFRSLLVDDRIMFLISSPTLKPLIIDALYDILYDFKIRTNLSTIMDYRNYESTDLKDDVLQKYTGLSIKNITYVYQNYIKIRNIPNNMRYRGEWYYTLKYRQ